MIHALALAGLLLFAASRGQAILLALTKAPIIGGFAAWVAQLLPVTGSGITSNIISGLVAAQIVVLTLAPVIYAPAMARKIAAWRRASCQAANT